MGESWRNSTVDMNRILFDGSAGSVAKLSTLIEDGRMLDTITIEETERNDLQNNLKSIMAAYMIPLTWRMSPENFWPIIIAVCTSQSP